MTEARLLDLGQAGYQDTWDQQLALVAERQRGEGQDTLILVEHPHVITLGRSQKAKANVLVPGDVPVVEIERGGDVTYHGPGQLVMYPILALTGEEKDLHKFLRNLEEGVIRALGDLGLAQAGRRAGATGVWIGAETEPLAQRKIASIGIACRKWVTFHGVALNVATDLSYFTRINPCGFESGVMTSMVREGTPVTVGDVKPAIARRLGETLGRAFAA